MTVKELKEKLNNYPDDMDIVICGGKSDFTYAPLESVRKQVVRFCEDEDNPNEEPFCDEECVVLDEEYNPDDSDTETTTESTSKNSIVGKEAIIECVQSSIKQLGISTLLPGSKVKIIKYDGYSDAFGDCYRVSDDPNISDDLSFIIPLKWLNIIEV